MATVDNENEHPVAAHGYAARDSSGHLSPFKFSRRATGERDVAFRITYCGICHSDLHGIKNEWGIATYPRVPGHEVVGIVTEVGSKVTRYKVGDRVGVGGLVQSCGSCTNCAENLESYCPRMIFICGGINHDGTRTFGGFSNFMVCDENFVIGIPDSLPMDGAAPLLCAGITVYSPLKYYGLDKPGMHVGVAGLGGLGHMAVKFAKAMGLRVTVISTSPTKRAEAMERLGVDAFLVSQDTKQLQDAIGTMDGVLDTVSANHSIVPLLSLLKTNGKVVLLGAPKKPLKLPAFPVIMGRKLVGGSCIGGPKEMQEMIEFAAKHDITADIEVIPIDYVNTAMERLEKSDIKYRFVIDIANTLKP